MWDSNSKAKSIEISLIFSFFKMIFFKNLDLAFAAEVVPGNTLYIKKFKLSFRCELHHLLYYL